MRRALLVAVLAASLGACEADDSSPVEPSVSNPAPFLEAPESTTDTTESLPSMRSEGPAGVVLEYYGAIAAKDYARASALWGPDTPPGYSPGDLEDAYSGMMDINAFVDAPVELDGPANSTRVRVPVSVIVTRVGGVHRIEGEYVLRRANDAEGVEPWEQRWHLHSATLTNVE